MRVFRTRTAITLLPYLLACGGDDASVRETTSTPSTSSDAATSVSDAAARADTSADANDASSDAGSPSSDAATASSDAAIASSDAASVSDAGAPPPPPPLTLERALDPTGIDISTERAMLVIDAACKARVPCGEGGTTLADCVDLTINEWALGALFFPEECVDAQVDLYACLATPSCDSGPACAERRAAQASFCAMEL